MVDDKILADFQSQTSRNGAGHFIGWHKKLYVYLIQNTEPVIIS